MGWVSIFNLREKEGRNEERENEGWLAVKLRKEKRQWFHMGWHNQYYRPIRRPLHPPNDKTGAEVEELKNSR